MSSTEADTIIRSYTDAISDFLSGMNQCRGLIASRHFRGPGGSQWAQFRILPLSETRRLDVVRKAELEPKIEQELVAQIAIADAEVREMIRNPMLLGLLCVHMKSGFPFPSNMHTLFATYIENRLTRDRDRLWRRFKIEPAEVRPVAENVAYCMAADLRLGLSPSREQLKDSLTRQGMPISDEAYFNTILDSLEFIKLARSEVSMVGDSKPFTFAHRRFQEYFATCVALREPQRVTTRDLIKDARWRETAVVMCQTQPIEALAPILNEVRHSLADVIASIPERLKVNADSDEGREVELPQERFPWPPAALHILSLLQDGCGRRLKDLTHDIRSQAATVVLSASRKGGHFDRKWALEVAGIVPTSVLTQLIRSAFSTESRTLRDVAYHQVARLAEIPEDIVASIHRALMALALNGDLRSQRYATRAHLARLDKANRFIQTLRLLLWIPFVDLFLHAALFFSVPVMATRFGLQLGTRALLGFLVLCVISHISFGWPYYPRVLFGRLYPTIGFLTRFYSLFAIFGLFLIVFFEVFERAGLPFGMLIIYTAAWMPSAVLAARMGQFTRPAWWPLMPVLPVFILAQNAKSLLVRLIKSRITIRTIAMVFLSILVWGALMWIFTLFDLFRDRRVALFMMLAALLSFGLVSYPLVKDRIQWARRFRGYPSSMTPSVFLKSLEGYSTGAFRLRLIQLVRKKQSLVATAEAENVARLCLSLERDAIQHRLRQTGDRAKSVTASPTNGGEKDASRTGDDFDMWYENHFRRAKRFNYRWTFEILDELSFILEQVRVRRQN